MGSIIERFTSIWRPSVPESIDGKPLATTIEDLFVSFPYDRLPSNPWVAFFLRPEVVLGLLLFYIIFSKPLFKTIRDVTGLDSKGGIFRAFVAVHNLALAIFSGVCAYNSWPVVVTHWMEHGFMATYCDREGTLWESGLGAWATIFYLSKYYEFLDSWILILKGKDASFLQVYHHTGIVFTMWMGVASQSAWLLVVVLLNSVIHTLMYTYFLIKTISPKTEIKAAKNLTMMQIGQFITGITSSSGVIIMGESCDTQSSRFGLACLQAYGLGLIALFVSFAQRKYKKS